MTEPLSLSLQVTLIKNSPTNAGDLRDTVSIPGLGRSTEEENGNPLQYSCLENPMDRRVGRLQFTVLQRVGHDLSTEQAHM